MMYRKHAFLCLFMAALFVCFFMPAVSSAYAESGKKTVIVMFGENFNEPEYIADFLSYLDNTVGLEKNGGTVRSVVYPDDFKYGSRVRISILKNIISDENICGVIMLGAPEGSCNTLADVRNDISVYSFFPQDDMRGSEYIADFVLDNIDIERQIDAQKIFALTEKSIQFMQSDPGLVKNGKLKKEIQDMMGKSWVVHEYTHPETGIRSANHFIIESIVPPRTGTMQ